MNDVQYIGGRSSIRANVFFFKENEQTKQKHRVAKRNAIHGTYLSFLVPAHHIFVHQLAVLDIE